MASVATTPPGSMAIASVTMKGKLLLERHQDVFQGHNGPACGASCSQAQPLGASLGNVVDSGVPQEQGHTKAGLRRHASRTSWSSILSFPIGTSQGHHALMKATVSFTLSAPQLDKLGFDMEGISQPGGIAGKPSRERLRRRCSWAAAPVQFGHTCYLHPLKEEGQRASA